MSLEWAMLDCRWPWKSRILEFKWSELISTVQKSKESTQDLPISLMFHLKWLEAREGETSARSC